MSMERKKSVLLTGAAGFLGSGLHMAFEPDLRIRLADMVDFATSHEKMIGDVSDPEFCLRAAEGMDYLVIAHMYPRTLGYAEPFGPFNANVTGTANLLHAAHVNGVKRVCLISSESAVSGRPDGVPHSPELRPAARDVYSATKACQEITAEAFHREFGISTAVLRIGYVVDLRRRVDKYGKTVKGSKHPLIDPYDCGEAVRKVFELPTVEFRVFYIYSDCDSSRGPEGLAAYRELDWTPRFQSDSKSELENDFETISEPQAHAALAPGEPQ